MFQETTSIKNLEMEFSLIYQGPLPSAQGDTSRTPDKQRIRRLFSPQLQALWQTHPALWEYHSHQMAEGRLVQRHLELMNPPPDVVDMSKLSKPDIARAAAELFE